MKKYILVISAFFLVASAVTVVSCNKDSESTTKANTTFVANKKMPAFDQIQEILTDFYTACDLAYHKDKEAFLMACKENNEDYFMEMIGIKPEFMSNYCNIAQEKLDEFKNENPDFECDEMPYINYMEEALDVIGALESSTDGNLADLIPSTLLDYDYYNVYQAIAIYSGKGSEAQTISRISAHIGVYFQEVLSAKMNTEITVAQFISEPKDREDMPLSFDEMLFKQKYEKILKENTGDNWVAEEVNAYWFYNSELNEFVPVFHVSAYNTTKEVGSNLYLVSSVYNGSSSTFNVVCRAVIPIKCTAKDGCGNSEDGGCDLTSTPNLSWTCTKCKWTGWCKKETGDAATHLFAVSNVLFDLK